MKHLILLAFLGLIVFASCDRRTTKRDALKEAITKFQSSVEPIEMVEYIPDEYSEIQTDTILNNGFKVKIKTYSDMKTSVVHSYKKDAVTIQKDMYRNWISEVKVEKDGHLIFEKVIDNNFFFEHKKINKPNSYNVLITGVEVDESLTSLEKNYVYLSTGYLFPNEKESNFLFTLKIDDKGNYSLEQLNASTKTI